CYSLLFLLLLAVPLPSWIGQQGFRLLALTSAISGLLLVVIFRRGWLAGITNRAPRRITSWAPPGVMTSIAAALTSLRVLRQRRPVGAIVFWSVVIWVAATLTNYCVLRALHIQAPATSALVVLVVLQLGITLSSIPGTLGIFEYLCLVVLSLFGVAQSAALGFAVLLHLLVLLPTFVGLFLFWRAGFSLTQTVRLNAATHVP
ncbi:MAG: lysylphosphatidylglycerol synthase domain-containing protein, partial [Ardenticatenaceae bacterium]